MLAIKLKVDCAIIHKVRIVIGGHRDKIKEFMVHFTQTLQPLYKHQLPALFAVFDFQVWTAGVTQVFQQ